VGQFGALNATIGMASILFRIAERSEGRFKVCRTAAEIRDAVAQGKIAAIFHIEGAEAIDPDLKSLDVLHQAGLRSLGLVWSRDNAFGHGVPFKFPSSPDTGPGLTEAGKALVRRTGGDLTIVAGSIMLHRALEAAEKLAAEGINVEVIDLRSIRPIDRDTILTSVRKTGKLLVVYEGVKAYGVGAEISAMVAESDAFDYLDAPILRLGAVDAPVPYNPDLERASVPQVDTIEAAARRLVRREV
jgi:hypothetical protein